MMHISRLAALSVSMLLLSDIALADGGYLPMFNTPAEAKQHCPYDIITWVDGQAALPHHTADSSNAVKGGYICRQEAINAGYPGLVIHLPPAPKH